MNEKPTVKKVAWQDIRTKLQAVNPELTSIIDHLHPSDKKYHLYEATYPYGYQSVRKGKFYLPNKAGEIVALDHSSVDPKIQEDLSYNLGTNPVTILLKNSIEIFLEFSQNIVIPCAIAGEGILISTGVVIDLPHNHQPAFLWNISAGARSIFSLSKLSVTKKLDKLKSIIDFDINKPSAFTTHHHLFSALANSPSFGDNWQVKLLYFGKEWFQHLKDKAWKDFTLYLYQKAWKGTAYSKTEFIWNLIFSLIQRKRNLKPDPFLADLVKHLLLMGLGQYPGFAPALDDSCAPISKIQTALTDIYHLDKYPPIIMSPAYFSMEKRSRPIYYFLAHHTVFDFAPKGRQLASKRADLSDVAYLLKQYLNEITKGQLNLEHTPMNDIPNCIKYDFFHRDPDLTHGIMASSEIIKEDATFMQNAKDGMLFPASSPLLRGCVRIKNK